MSDDLTEPIQPGIFKKGAFIALSDEMMREASYFNHLLSPHHGPRRAQTDPDSRWLKMDLQRLAEDHWDSVFHTIGYCPRWSCWDRPPQFEIELFPRLTAIERWYKTKIDRICWYRGRLSDAWSVLRNRLPDTDER